MSEITIRTARLDDASKLVSIYRHYVEKTAITFEYEVPTVAEFRRRMGTMMQKYPYLVIEEDGVIQGYAYAGAFNPREAYDWSSELTIYMSHTARKGGLGRRLYEALVDQLRSMGILNVYACIGYPQQEDEYLTKNSEQFHRHLGFETVGTFHHCGYKFGRWYDMIWMEKMIGSHDSVQQSVLFPERKAYTITEIVEDDFGCEGRPEGAEPMVTVSLDGDHVVWGKVRIADAYLYEHHLDVGSVVHTTEMFLDSISVRP